jgi:ABC-2 type transport system ATP-binding protein
MYSWWFCWFWPSYGWRIGSDVVHIDVRRLTKTYGGGRGLLPTTLTISKGECVAVVGHNGAGKSTLLKTLASWLVPDDGDVLIDAVPITDRPSLVGKLGFVPEVPNLFESFSVEHNLRLFAGLFSLPGRRVEEILQEFSLEPFRRSKVQALSKGLRQRVSLGRTLLPDPSILLFDEPTSGLDFEATKEMYRRVRDLHVGGKTVLFSSHRPEEVKALATRIVVLHGGQVMFDGDPERYFSSKAHEDLYQ